MLSGLVYMLASKRNGTIYTGVTSDIPRAWNNTEPEKDRRS